MSLQKDFREIIIRTKSLTSMVFDSGGKLKYNFTGNVLVENPSAKAVIFNESAKWITETSLLINSTNVYRWTFCESGNIKLEHLRFGKSRPVFLVEFLKSIDNKWKSKEPHKCNNDFYSAELYLDPAGIVLKWNVIGPLNNYSIKTIYSDK